MDQTRDAAILKKPLVVDLDGTLLKSDIFWESYFSFLKLNPWNVFHPIRWWVTGGKQHLKSKLAQHVELNIKQLPYDMKVVEWLQSEKDSGRKLVLATATHEKYAEQVSQHLGLFDQVMATNARVNLSGTDKRDALVAEFGHKGFDYIGNAHDDLHVGQSAEWFFLVNPGLGLEKKARALNNVADVIHSRPASVKPWMKALRVHQWIKNILIFVPLVAAHQFNSLPLVVVGLLGFIAFSLCSSSVYLLNDLLDLEDDRQHAKKQKRPFASGALTIQSGLLAIPLLLLTSFMISAVFLPAKFMVCLILYYLTTLFYSLIFKRIVMMDVVVLAGLYTSRIVAGLLLFNLQPTFWMLVFSLFIFMSLALVKRYTELDQMAHHENQQKLTARGYYISDKEIVASLGATSGYLSVLVMALYVNDQHTSFLYTYPQIIWFACPILLFWISRTWLLTHRGLMDDDPVIFAVKDKVSLLTGALFLLVFWIAA